MRSRASIDGHPIHPALIPFPIAFLSGALIFDALGRVLDGPALWTTGGYLLIAGIVGALVAAVPGLIDYLKTVPPNSSGKRRATKHMILNLSAVASFGVALWLRGVPSAEPGLATLGFEVMGVALMAVGGWMGGVLVNRNQIGVDHRYAGAGRWNEASFDAKSGEWCTVARADELEPNQMKLLHLGGERVVLARTGEGWAAFDDRCTHRGASLADGAMICGVVQCPWHGSQFDVRTGRVEAGPAEQGIAVRQVEERDGEVRLKP